MESKYPVGTPKWVMSACEELHEQADQNMTNEALNSDFVRGYYAAAHRLKELTEHEARLESARDAQALKEAGQRILEKEQRLAEPS
jgi:hypothetical protein